MTCIIALKSNDKIYFGSDSYIGSNGNYNLTKEPKVFKIGEMLFGVAGYPRLRQIIEYNLTVKPQKASQTDLEFVVTEVAENIRKLAKEGGYSWDSSNHQYTEDKILLGYKGDIYQIDSNFQVIQNNLDFYCIGSGEDYAKAAMQALEHTNNEDRIRRSLAISAMFCNTVKDPFHITTLG